MSAAREQHGSCECLHAADAAMTGTPRPLGLCRSVWLMHAANSRGWVAKVADFGLSRNSTGFLPLTAVAHAPPELMLKVGVWSACCAVSSIQTPRRHQATCRTPSALHRICRGLLPMLVHWQGQHDADAGACCSCDDNMSGRCRGSSMRLETCMHWAS